MFGMEGKPKFGMSGRPNPPPDLERGFESPLPDPIEGRFTSGIFVGIGTSFLTWRSPPTPVGLWIVASTATVGLFGSKC
jgi:hypothetical protein